MLIIPESRFFSDKNINFHTKPQGHKKVDGIVKKSKPPVLSFRAKREILVLQSFERPLSRFWGDTIELFTTPSKLLS
jgi:hypothetical protein